MSSEFHLHAHGLACERSDRLLFSGLDLEVRPGEVWSVEGANGSGKTTLLRILAGLRSPDDGSVRWNGASIEAVRPEYNASIAYLGHASAVKSDLTGLENLHFMVSLRRSPAELERALAHVGLGDHDDLPVRTYSAGQRRRLAMAALWHGEARVWLLDEPFTALDPAGRALVRDLLAEHVAGGGAAVLATHHPVEVVGARERKLTLGLAG